MEADKNKQDAAIAGTRVLIISLGSSAPEIYGGGNQAIRWGMIDGLTRAGMTVGYYSINPPGKSQASYPLAKERLGLSDDRFWFNKPAPGRSKDGISAIAHALETFQPDVILGYGWEVLNYAREAGFKGPVGLMSVDLEFLSTLHRHVHNLRFGRLKQQIKSTLTTPKVLLKAFRTYKNVVTEYPKVDFVLNHAAHHAEWHAAKHKIPVLRTPNPLSPIYDKVPSRHPAKPPRFLMVGRITGIATITGLSWFATRVYPLIEENLRRKEFEIHLIGRADQYLETSIANKIPLLIRRGELDDMEEEYASATAMLVPTPITIGFRTRIVDAFRHALPVIAHVANARGMPELKDGRNALVPASPEAFAQAIVTLARDPAEAERVGAGGFADFTNELSSHANAQKMAQFISGFVDRDLKRHVEAEMDGDRRTGMAAQ